jgi:hypothetical protein
LPRRREAGTTGPIEALPDFGGEGKMRYLVPLVLMLGTAACSTDAPGSAKLTLRNTVWDRVNVQVVITRAAECDQRGPDFVGSQEFVLQRDQTKTIVAPEGTSVCWRHDRYPDKPQPGQWSGWAKAILFPGNDTSSDL